MRTRTGKISVAGTVMVESSQRLSAALTAYLKTLALGRANVLLDDDGDNYFVRFNDGEGTEVFFERDNATHYLVQVMNSLQDSSLVKLTGAMAQVLNDAGLPYRLEVQYEYDDGEWRDDEEFRHPNYVD